MVADLDDWTVRQILALRSKGSLEQWVADRWEKNRISHRADAFRKLVEGCFT